ncbi:MAG: hypothetical protein AAFN81_11275 [Bacteroidota bacterium]
MKKTKRSLLQLTNYRGHFFPVDDAQNGRSFHAYELVTAVDQNNRES